jgi:hypothetical protein
MCDRKTLIAMAHLNLDQRCLFVKEKFNL